MKKEESVLLYFLNYHDIRACILGVLFFMNPISTSKNVYLDLFLNGQTKMAGFKKHEILFLDTSKAL